MKESSAHFCFIILKKNKNKLKFKIGRSDHTKNLETVRARKSLIGASNEAKDRKALRSH